MILETIEDYKKALKTHKIMIEVVEKGHPKKGCLYNIYDSNLRNQNIMVDGFEYAYSEVKMRRIGDV